MKKNKLGIEKFRIAKLSNPLKIVGGNIGDDGETGKKGRCIKMSDIIIKDI